MEKIMFDLEKFDIKLGTDVIGRNFTYADEVTSTNSELLNNKNFYKHHGTVLLAEKQTEGKGRLNRKWISASELNLTFSILVTLPLYLTKNINILNYAASLAVAVSIENLFQLRTELKWPNDVLVGGKKIAGILIESTSKGSNINRLVIGIGLNVNQVSFQGKYLIAPTSLKAELGYPVEREKTLAEVLNNVEMFLNTSQKSPGKILNEWKTKCKMLGERITIVNNDVTKHGIFSDIDRNGFLVLRNKEETEILHFGDVSIL
jgi:BirA family transcriptional regulator, biotin operon repressor / biotin---[acetyl-CoA-carboxylase] ligase